jgi:hypothetical protein
MWKSCLLVLIGAGALQAADACMPQKLAGNYAFQLSGMTNISGTPQPTTSLGKMVFDGSGKLSGTSSAMFSGLLLGNPITGTYEAKEDCTLTWQLQDDSGAFQHFAGKMSQDMLVVNFRQTDPGGTRGVMEKTPDSCTSGDLQKTYHYTASGRTKAMQAGQAEHTVAAKGTIEAGSLQVDSDCTIHFVLNLPDTVATMRGFLVNAGKEILAFQTDPGAMVSARLTVEATTEPATPTQ